MLRRPLGRASSAFCLASGQSKKMTTRGKAKNMITISLTLCFSQAFCFLLLTPIWLLLPPALCVCPRARNCHFWPGGGHWPNVLERQREIMRTDVTKRIRRSTIIDGPKAKQRALCAQARKRDRGRRRITCFQFCPLTMFASFRLPPSLSLAYSSHSLSELCSACFAARWPVRFVLIVCHHSPGGLSILARFTLITALGPITNSYHHHHSAAYLRPGPYIC